jgi:hypothetical protein
VPGEELDHARAELRAGEDAAVAAAGHEPALRQARVGSRRESREVGGRHEAILLAVDEQQGDADLPDPGLRRQLVQRAAQPPFDHPADHGLEGPGRKMKVPEEAPGDRPRVREGGAADKRSQRRPLASSLSLASTRGHQDRGRATQGVAHERQAGRVDVGSRREVAQRRADVLGEGRDGDRAVAVAGAVPASVEVERPEARLVELGCQAPHLGAVRRPTVNQGDRRAGGRAPGRRDVPAVEAQP